MNRLKIEEEQLLIGIIEQRAQELLPLVGQLGEIKLTVEQREGLREAIADEFVDTGLNKNDEPNARGMLLESIIDKLGHY